MFIDASLIMGLFPLTRSLLVLDTGHMSPVHTSVEIKTNSKPGDATVFVCQSEHKTCLLLDSGPPPVCPQTSVRLTEVDHVPG